MTPSASRFQVQFQTPTLGHTTVPIGIDGVGTVELGADAVVVRGLKQPTLRLLTLVFYAAVFAAWVLGAVVGTSLGFTTRYAALTGVALASALATLGSARLRAHKAALAANAAEPLVLTLPWPQVRALKPGEVGWVLLVKRSLLTTESVHFSLSDATQTEPLVSAFEATRTAR
jgi:hypothetical protein